MQLPFLIARRYIFSKKSTNAINIISGISIFGMGIGSMALVVILSVFNGFEGILENLIGNFKPDVIITAKKGKVFVFDNKKIEQINNIEGVQAVSSTLEEIALLEYEGVQNIGSIKGVDKNYINVSNIDTCIKSGKYKLSSQDKRLNFALVGSLIERTLGISVSMVNQSEITVYMPKRTKKNLNTSPGSKPFRKRIIYPSATYSVQQPEYDAYVLTNLEFVQELNAYKKGEISSIEIKLDPKTNQQNTIDQIKKIAGSEFSVKNRYEQDEALFKITNLEKYVAYLIFSFTLILVAFNMIGALWMLVLEKKNDILILRSMGATKKMIRNIFLMEGLLMSGIGLFSGCATAFLLCFLQQNFGLVQLAGDGNFIIDAYPVEMRITDFITVIITVISIGLLASYIPAKRASGISIIKNN